MMKDIGYVPDWDDVGIVYDRMQSRGLLRIRAKPGGITGHIMSCAVFARAARMMERFFDMEMFIDLYCKCKEIDQDKFLSQIHDYLDELGHLDTDPIALLEVLSAY